MGILSGHKLLLRAETIASLAWARLLIRFVPFRWWRTTLGPLGHPDSTASTADLPPESELRALQIGRFVTRMADRVPFEAVCLPQAMAARWMLARRGIATQIVIGSHKGEATGNLLQVHAWLLAGRETVTGKDESGLYQAFAGQEHKPG